MLDVSSDALSWSEHVKNGEYSGHRILEAMRSAPRYADAVYAMAKASVARTNKQIVEFGAGDGAFVERFRNDGHSVVCVEPDRRNQEALRTLDVKVVADVADLPDASFSYIYTINVLEHLTDLEGSLMEIYRVLRPGGALFVFVPAFNCLWTSLDDEVGHVQRFTTRSLAAAVRKAGFMIQAAHYFDSLGFVAAIGVRILERLGLFQYSKSTVGFYDRYLLPVSLISDRAFSKLVGKNVVLLATKGP
jgi:SAM-dependent methyltransferase